MKTPILLITWNRPYETRALLENLATVRPTQLFVSGDGPRDNLDTSLIQEVKSLIEEHVVWPCEVRTSYSDTHLGCKNGVVRAIDWFFENVSEGIILEDDILPHADFFVFCETLLELYRENPRVMHISGDNSAEVAIEEDWSYCFIRYPHIWGWATWKSSWELYDRNMEMFSKFDKSGFLPTVFSTKLEQRIWTPIFRKMARTNEIDTWDWQWAATVFMNEALAVQPTKNLVSNIGFNSAATHTKESSRRSEFQNSSIGKIRHPEVVWVHSTAQAQVVRNSQISLLTGWSFLRIPTLIERAFREIKKAVAGHRYSFLSKYSRH